MTEKNISFKIDSELDRELKIKLAKEDKKLKTYMIELIKKDLEK